MSRQQKAVDRARKAFETGRSKPLEYRIHQLKNLQRLLTERKKEIADAIKKDLGKVSTTSASTPRRGLKRSNILKYLKNKCRDYDILGLQIAKW